MGVIGVDVARVRGLYPTVAASTAQLDGSFAALAPESVVRAIIATLRTAPAQPGGLLASDWRLGDEIVLNRLDADVAARPWLQAARARGVVVRWSEVDLETGEVPS